MPPPSRAKSPGRSRKKQTASRPNLLLVIGLVVVVVGLLGFGVLQLRGGHSAPQTVADLSAGQLESTSLDAAPANRASLNVHNAEASDELTQYLGPRTNMEVLAQVESGNVDKPTLVWFHADWCHVCQQITPEMVELGKTYEGQVNFVRLDVDDPAARRALSLYGVRGTPTFVLFDANGQLRGNVPGWPGYNQVIEAFDALLAGG
ncbi:MAG: thioredoxin domain-containing protein [Anaerolineae bacterium]